MQCNCYSEVRKNLLEHYKKQLPENIKECRVNMDGTSLVFGKDHSMSEKPSIPVEVTYKQPKKNGSGLTNKKIKSQFICAYCPICGTKVDADKKDATNNQD